MSSRPSPAVSGVLPVLPTPFTAGGDIAPDRMRALIKFAATAGAAGVTYPGVASEGDQLSLDERRTMIEIVGAERGSLTFVVGASAETAADAVTLCAWGQKTGAAAAMVMAPKALGADVDVLVDHFTAIAAEVTLPLILQNAQPPAGAGLPVEVVIEVVRRVPAIAYVKEEALPSGPRITSLLDQAPDSLLGVMGGGGARYVYDELERGAAGAMPALEIADAHAALWAAYMAGERMRARQIYIRTLPLLLVQQIYRMVLTKQVLLRRGLLDNAVVRAPLPAFDAAGHAELDMLVAELEDLLIPADGAAEGGAAAQ